MTPVVLTPREMLARLVAFDTTSSGSNMALIEFVRDYLAGHGIESVLVRDGTQDKANLFATIGPRDRGGIALSGHTDCVPVTDQDWSSDPFTLTERDGRLFGRGACDMKGFIAAALSLVPEFRARPLATPIHLALSYDEEVGCAGVRSMIEALGRHLPMPRAVIVGEPTGMEVVDAHKSISDYMTRVTGHSVHSAQIDRGANAIIAAARLIGELARLRDERIAAGDASGRFTPPFTSIHVGMISGGTALNIVPRHCRFSWEVRALPDFEPARIADAFDSFARAQVLPGMRAVSSKADIETFRHIFVPGLAPEPESPAETLAMRLGGRTTTATVSFASEAGLFQGHGVPAIVCGPGDIAQAHQPDEFLEVSQLEACCTFLRRLGEAAEGCP